MNSGTPDHKSARLVVWRCSLLTHLPRSREQLFALFWPDKERADARQAFHNARYQAHQALGRAVIAYEDGFYSIAWDPNCWFDVQALEFAGRRAGPGMALYRGDFLEGYDADPQGGKTELPPLGGDIFSNPGQ